MPVFLFLLCLLLSPSVHCQENVSNEVIIKALLSQKLDEKTFSLTEIIHASTGKNIIPLDEKNPAHARIVAAINLALRDTRIELSRPESPLKNLRRINEASHFFEDLLQKKISAIEGMKCEFPTTSEGKIQRSGYPDLLITDLASGTHAYLDPKLLATGTLASTLRTFYYEPKRETSKIHYDALHLLCGIEHNGLEGHWLFTKHHLVDLSHLQVRLKTEFQASNADLYQNK